MLTSGFGAAAAAVIASTLFASGAVAQTTVDPIVIKGSKFFYKTNGTQFFMRGVAYQQDYTGGGSMGTGNSSTTQYSDPLADKSACSRDIPYMTRLSTNTIRVYALDPTANHDACMNALAAAGIYVVADLSEPLQSINRDAPEWNEALYTRYTAVVDAMAGYSNTLGFFAGNEVSNAPNNTDASAFVKAAVRDTKAYIKQKNYRTIGVGYATNDDADIRVNMADYFNCGDAASSIDFWGYNIYSWCGDSSFHDSGYDVRTKEFSTYSVPVFFAEYGCNQVQPRPFTEVGALFGSEMTGVWSGGIVYMYFQEANNYGLVSVSGNTVSTLTDFDNLSSQLAKVTPTGVNSASYSPTNSAAACPTGSDWAAKSSPLPPTPNAELCSCMYQTLSCVPAPSVSDTEYGNFFGVVCGTGDGSQCNGIAHNATTGDFGAYGMCSAKEQLGFALNAYYNAQSGSNQASACNFGGSATTQAATSAGGSCSSLVAEAGTAGTGVVTSQPTGTGAASGGSSGGASGSAGAASSSAGAFSISAPGSSSGMWQAGSLVVVAMVSGMGMILL
nr:hypothetical protein B0A51_16365 [Rachicladosporium sp. CCFEE 5018]